MNTVRRYLPLAGMIATTCVAAFLAARQGMPTDVTRRVVGAPRRAGAAAMIAARRGRAG